MLATLLGKISKAKHLSEKGIEHYYTIYTKSFSFFVVHKHAVKHINTLHIPKSLQKNLNFFFTV